MDEFTIFLILTVTLSLGGAYQTYISNNKKPIWLTNLVAFGLYISYLGSLSINEKPGHGGEAFAAFVGCFFLLIIHIVVVLITIMVIALLRNKKTE